MAIIKWEPFRDIERFFDDEMSLLGSKFGWDLAVDVYEEAGNMVAEMQLPGIDPDRVDIAVDRDVLTISGAREEEKETKEKHYYAKEIRRGSFQRTVRLPHEGDASAAAASYEGGVLKVIIPKREQQGANKIKVQVKK